MLLRSAVSPFSVPLVEAVELRLWRMPWQWFTSCAEAWKPLATAGKRWKPCSGSCQRRGEALGGSTNAVLHTLAIAHEATTTAPSVLILVTPDWDDI